MTFTFDFDDFSPKNTNLGLLEQIKDHYPNFKVTLFTVPWEIRFGDQTPITQEKYKPFCEAVKKSADWLEIALHGLTHAPEEFKNLTYSEAQKRLLIGEKMFVNRGIPFAKIFKAPYWQLSSEAKSAARDLGWLVAEDGYYNWNLKDDMPKKPMKRAESDEWMVAHGHVQNVSGNGIEESMWRILRLPTDTKFAFLSEYFRAEKIDPSMLDFRDPLEHTKVLIDGKELK